MFRRLINHFRTRRQQCQESQRREGYDYAKGLLEQFGVHTVRRLEDEADSPFESSYFQLGINDALCEFYATPAYLRSQL